MGIGDILDINVGVKANVGSEVLGGDIKKECVKVGEEGLHVFGF